MVVAEALGEAIKNIILVAFDQVAAPALGAAAQPARDLIINALPIVFSSFGGFGGWVGAVPLF